MSNAPRHIGVITTSRADYGIYSPILKRLRAADDLSYGLYVTGTHLSKEHGHTVERIEADGHPILARAAIIQDGDSAQDIARAMGATTQKFADIFADATPDLLLVLGDRYEMLAAALAAVPFNIPIAHIHGGEVSEGAIDDVFRHSLTKISHLHFAATALSAQRIIQMGEDPSRVIVSGAPALDHLNEIDFMDRSDLQTRFDIPADQPYMVCTYHPVTTETDQVDAQISSLLSAIQESGIFTIFTAANADTFGQKINNAIQSFVSENTEKSAFVETMGPRGYFSAIKNAAAVIGNSSSGIIEAASFKTPVINIGNRQKGREQSDNILNCNNETVEILSAIQEVQSDVFLQRAQAADNIYGQGNVADKIIDTIRSVNLKNIIVKSFHMLD